MVKFGSSWIRKIRNAILGAPGEKVSKNQIPDEWGGEKKKGSDPPRPDIIEKPGHWKLRRVRVPILRKMNKLVAGAMFIFNFSTAIGSLYAIGGMERIIICLAFVFNSYLCMRVVWDRRV